MINGDKISVYSRILRTSRGILNEQFGEGGDRIVSRVLSELWRCGRFLGPELSNSNTAFILHRTQTP